MPDLPVCRDCGMVNPPPEQTCPTGLEILTHRDHFVGTGRGCPSCGRLVEACIRRPCQVFRDTGYEVEDGIEEDGDG